MVFEKLNQKEVQNEEQFKTDVIKKMVE